MATDELLGLNAEAEAWRVSMFLVTKKILHVVSVMRDVKISHIYVV